MPITKFGNMDTTWTSEEVEAQLPLRRGSHPRTRHNSQPAVTCALAKTTTPSITRSTTTAQPIATAPSIATALSTAMPLPATIYEGYAFHNDYGGVDGIADGSYTNSEDSDNGHSNSYPSGSNPSSDRSQNDPQCSEYSDNRISDDPNRDDPNSDDLNSGYLNIEHSHSDHSNSDHSNSDHSNSDHSSSDNSNNGNWDSDESDGGARLPLLNIGFLEIGSLYENSNDGNTPYVQDSGVQEADEGSSEDERGDGAQEQEAGEASSGDEGDERSREQEAGEASGDGAGRDRAQEQEAGGAFGEDAGGDRTQETDTDNDHHIQEHNEEAADANLNMNGHASRPRGDSQSSEGSADNDIPVAEEDDQEARYTQAQTAFAVLVTAVVFYWAAPVAEGIWYAAVAYFAFLILLMDLAGFGRRWIEER